MRTLHYWPLTGPSQGRKLYFTIIKLQERRGTVGIVESCWACQSGATVEGHPCRELLPSHSEVIMKVVPNWCLCPVYLLWPPHSACTQVWSARSLTVRPISTAFWDSADRLSKERGRERQFKNDWLVSIVLQKISWDRLRKNTPPPQETKNHPMPILNDR